MKKKDIEKVTYLQKIWKNILIYKQDIIYEVTFFTEILNIIITQLNDKFIKNLIENTDFKKSTQLIEYCKKILEIFPHKITVKFLSENSKFKILSCLAKIKLTIIEITNLIGCIKITDSIQLYLGLHDKQNLYKKENKDFFYYINKYFEVLKVDLYHADSTNSLKYNLSNFSSNKKTHSIILKKNDNKKPVIYKNNEINTELIKNCKGCYVYIPINKNILVFFGFFKEDNINSFKALELFTDKNDKLSTLIENIDVYDEFKQNYLNSIGLRDFYLYDANQITSICISNYNFLKTFKNKDISNMVKEFLTSDMLKQRNIIQCLLFDNNDTMSKYIANLLLDLIRSDNITISMDKKNKIVNSLHWSIRKKINSVDDTIDDKTNYVNENIEDTIPYEKRIHLMKTEEYIKNKALDKLKEINGSKNGENTAKAQQYLDGILKIPFNTYKNEIIKFQLQELIDKTIKINSEIVRYIQYMEENWILSDDELKNSEELIFIIETFNIRKKNNILSINKFYTQLNNWKNKIETNCISIDKIYNIELLNDSLTKLKMNELKYIANIIDIKEKKKDKIIEHILKSTLNKNQLECIKKNILFSNPKYSIISNTKEFIEIKNLLDKLNTYYKKYIDFQNKYINKIDYVLNNAVYGLTQAKNQIKRLLCQWINGENQGYVFGFEGPPGTGKTTLAKKGISNCLVDELGNKRPFIFIALGGSSNGSTLEGHNYTYVGSSWGRIIEGIIEAKCMNPIIYIDELDKISKTEQGKEIIGILTHLTDPSQNTEFTDKYFSGVKFDISKSLIIFSYNDASLIDKILLDRIQRIKIDALNRYDKIMVTKQFIIPEILENIGYEKNDIKIDDEEISYIIDIYTYEAGARKLKERLYELYREINIRVLSQNTDILPFHINKKFIDNVFENCTKHDITKVYSEAKIGLINGLFATSSGVGGITLIECKKFFTNNHLELKLTGQQGDVMKESMYVARDLALNLIPDIILNNINKSKNKFGIHIHCPSGSTPKDGPSAGTAITVCIISLLCDIPINNLVAITGEIDLNGNVLPIGGLDSKVDGGKFAGVKHILCPSKNIDDLNKIRKRTNQPENNNFKVSTINNIYDALEITLIMNNKKIKDYFKKI